MLERAVPIYEDLPGWQCDTTEARTVEDLPINAQNYVRFLSRISGAPIRILGIGPARDEVMDVPAVWLDAVDPLLAKPVLAKPVLGKPPLAKPVGASS